MKVSQVALEALRHAWPTACRLLKPAIDRSYGRHSMATVFNDIRSGQIMLWVIYADDLSIRCAYTTRIAKYPLKGILVVDFLGGEGIGDWLPLLLGSLDRYAADLHLNGIELAGRAGWAKALHQFGWQQSWVVCEKSTPPALE